MLVLPITYFGPIGYYARLFQEQEVMIEACEHYVKQTERSRCLIAAGANPMTLAVSVQKARSGRVPVREVQLSDHGNWIHQHLQSLATYYGNSPFYEYYVDEIRDILEHGHDGSLFEMNEALRRKICELIGFSPVVHYTDEWMGTDALLDDFKTRELPEYYQIARSDHQSPFIPDLSILDLLFNMGPESILILNRVQF